MKSTKAWATAPATMRPPCSSLSRTGNSTPNAHVWCAEQAYSQVMNVQNKPPHEPPRRIQVRPEDNVAIVVNQLGLPAGTEFPDGLVLNAFVPNGHKVALTDIPDGGDIRRYNEVIGTAKGDIR